MSEQDVTLKPDDEVLIVGQGLAGTCLAWRMWDRRIKFRLLDRADRRDGTAGAGIVTPVTGHGMHLEWQADRFLDEAVEFYRTIEAVLAGEQYFYPFPALRVFGDEHERELFEGKRDELEPWIGEVHDTLGGGVRGGGQRRRSEPAGRARRGVYLPEFGAGYRPDQNGAGQFAGKPGFGGR